MPTSNAIKVASDNQTGVTVNKSKQADANAKVTNGVSDAQARQQVAESNLKRGIIEATGSNQISTAINVSEQEKTDSDVSRTVAGATRNLRKETGVLNAATENEIAGVNNKKAGKSLTDKFKTEAATNKSKIAEVEVKDKSYFTDQKAAQKRRLDAQVRAEKAKADGDIAKSKQTHHNHVVSYLCYL